MKGMGTKKLKHCLLEIHGIFDNNLVNGKGYKKWKRYALTSNSTTYQNSQKLSR